MECEEVRQQDHRVKKHRTLNIEHRTSNDRTLHKAEPLRCSGFGIRHSVFSFGLRASLLAVAYFTIAGLAPAQVDEAPYFGDWENNRGDTLQITSTSIQVNNEKAVRYDDITEDSDEQSFFVLQIKSPIELSYFGGNFLRITFGKDPDHFTMSIYKTLPDTLKQQNEVKRIEWSAPAEEKEEAEEGDQKNEEQKQGESKATDQPNDDRAGEKAKPSPSVTPSASPP
jgi:hypothetical protein